MSRFLRWSAVLLIASLNSACGYYADGESTVRVSERSTFIPALKADWQIRERFALEADITTVSAEDEGTLRSGETLVLGENIVREGPANLNSDARFSAASLLARFDFVRKPHFDFDFLVGVSAAEVELKINDGVSRWRQYDHGLRALSGVAITGQFADGVWLRGKLLRDPFADLDTDFASEEFQDAELLLIYRLSDQVDVFAGWRDVVLKYEVGDAVIPASQQTGWYTNYEHYRTYADFNFSGFTLGFWMNF
jgi:hypothetical protein